MLGTPQIRRLCLVGRRLCSVLTLLTCVVTSVGLPIGQSFGDPSSRCRCDEGLKVAGQCCCTKANSSGSARSCCGSKARSGCQASPESDAQFVSACNCGGPSNSQIFVNAEPRILLAAVMVPRIADGHRHSPLSDPRPPSRSMAPETPPPQVRPSRLSPV